MFALLVQHGAFYGVAVKLINDETAAALHAKMIAKDARYDGRTVYLETHTPGDKEDQATAWLIPVGEEMTFSFDTGKVEDGFKIIDDLLKDV